MYAIKRTDRLTKSDMYFRGTMPFVGIKIFNSNAQNAAHFDSYGEAVLLRPMDDYLYEYDIVQIEENNT